MRRLILPMENLSFLPFWPLFSLFQLFAAVSQPVVPNIAKYVYPCFFVSKCAKHHELGMCERWIGKTSPRPKANPARLCACPLFPGSLSGRKILITGGTHGLGFETAVRLATAGATLMGPIWLTPMNLSPKKCFFLLWRCETFVFLAKSPKWFSYLSCIFFCFLMFLIRLVHSRFVDQDQLFKNSNFDFYAFSLQFWELFLDWWIHATGGYHCPIQSTWPASCGWHPGATPLGIRSNGSPFPPSIWLVRSLTGVGALAPCRFETRTCPPPRPCFPVAFLGSRVLWWSAKSKGWHVN